MRRAGSFGVVFALLVGACLGMGGQAPRRSEGRCEVQGATLVFDTRSRTRL